MRLAISVLRSNAAVVCGNGDGFVELFIDDKDDVGLGQYAWLNDGHGVFASCSGNITLYTGTFDAFTDPGSARPGIDVVSAVKRVAGRVGAC